MKDVIPIVFSANEKYAPYIAVTAASIIRNASKAYFYRFYVLHTELSENMQLRLQSIEGENYSLNCINVEEQCMEGMYSAAYFSTEMYFRILIPELFKEYQKILYLDCDIVVLGDISELFHNELDGNLLGGMRNLMHAKMKKYVELSLGLEPENYINSGVLLLNAEQCREEHFTDRSFALLKKRRDFIYPDQDLINIMCRDRIKYLDPRWNFTWHYRHLQLSRNTDLHLSEGDMELFYEYEKNPKLIHYTGEIKPWNNVNKYLSDIFWDYAKDSVFYNLFLTRLMRSQPDWGNKESGRQEEMYRQIRTMQKQLAQLQQTMGMSAALKQENIADEPYQTEREPGVYLDKYNEVIGSASYRIGRLLTFPFRKVRDIGYSVKAVGIKETLKLFPGKMKLYKQIIMGKA